MLTVVQCGQLYNGGVVEVPKRPGSRLWRGNFEIRLCGKFKVRGTNVTIKGP